MVAHAAPRDPRPAGGGAGRTSAPPPRRPPGRAAGGRCRGAMTEKPSPIPSPRQTLLLRAALMCGERSVQAWHGWREGGELDDLDPASFRLLPLVYRNLLAAGLEDPEMP